MASAYAAVSVTTAATLLLAADNGRRGFSIANNGSNIVYLGFDAAVTSVTGTQLMPQEKFTLTGEQNVYKGAVFGITSAATSDVRTWTWTP